MHAVIIVVSVMTIGSTRDIHRLHDFYDQLVKMGYQPIFVISKMDTVQDEIIVNCPENLMDSGEVDRMMDSFCQVSRIPRSLVFPVINYQGPFKKPDYTVQILVTDILKTAATSAQNFLVKNRVLIQEEFEERQKAGKGVEDSKAGAPSVPLDKGSDDILDLAQATAWLKLTEEEVTDLLESKQIKGKKIGAKWRIRKEAIQQFLDSD